ncbi:Lrp/AsnC family transcriptional regulator [Oceanibium sediminis]|uniref:Lrp/AsnC family transcriptional regulator n=1 Tax=Oceanibium sediminis TaxID=2026339 RepID=UPI000DD44EB3|nr:Lrp/AsnC family transcriptional regulator [Oceanibium sediminis]
MDDLDRRLITALRHNGRAGISELAAILGVTRVTVRNRMARLEESGEITGYTVVLRNDAMRANVRGLMMIAIEGHMTERILRRIGTFPEVVAIHSTNGRWDLIAEIATDTLEALDEVLHAIRRIEGITASETNLLLSTPRSSRAAAL